LAAVRRQRPADIVIAVPVGAPETCRALAREVDALVCPSTPRTFHAVGQAYADFTPTSDAEVRDALSTR
jgi:predicted phosphoribosyltransferase